MGIVTEAEIINMLRTSCAQAGSARKFAAARGVSASLVDATLRGERDVSTSIAVLFGFVPVTRFEPMRRVG